MMMPLTRPPSLLRLKAVFRVFHRGINQRFTNIVPADKNESIPTGTGRIIFISNWPRNMPYPTNGIYVQQQEDEELEELGETREEVPEDTQEDEKTPEE